MRATAATEAVSHRLLDELEAGLGDRLGRPVRIIDVERKALDEYSTNPIARWQLHLDDGRAVPIICKRVVAKAGTAPSREVQVYRRLLAGGGLCAPVCYATFGDDWLFLEDVGRRRLDGCAYEAWERAACWLARMHATWTGRQAELRHLDCLHEHDAGFVQTQAAGARTAVAQRASAAALARLDRRLVDLETLTASVTALPRTLVHGDVSGHNVAVQAQGVIRPLDWEWAAIGGGAWDLVKLSAGWGRRKPDLLAAYLDAFDAAAGAPIDRPAFTRSMAGYGALKILWYLRWWVDGCDDPDTLSRMLTALESSWQHLSDV